jgi:hypothetical protein
MDNTDTITLVHNNQNFQVPRKAALISSYIKAALECDPSATEVPVLHENASDSLGLVVNYMNERYKQNYLFAKQYPSKYSYSSAEYKTRDSLECFSFMNKIGFVEFMKFVVLSRYMLIEPIIKVCYPKKICKIRLWWDACMQYGLLNLAKWLYGHNLSHRSRCDIQGGKVLAARYGHLDILKWLYERDNRLVVLTDCGKTNTKVSLMDMAATGGYLDVIKWLHEKKAPCTPMALENAAMNGHLEIVKWLCLNRTEGDLSKAIEWAADNVRQWYYNDR